MFLSLFVKIENERRYFLIPNWPDLYVFVHISSHVIRSRGLIFWKLKNQGVDLIPIIHESWLMLCICISSRKELRNKQETALQMLEHSIHYSNRINPSRVVQISWQPRSGPMRKFFFHFQFLQCDLIFTVFLI